MMRTTLALLALLAAGLLAPYIHRTPNRIDYNDIRTDAYKQLCSPSKVGDPRFVEQVS